MDEIYVIFGRNGCPYTESAKGLAEELGLNYKYYQVSRMPSSNVPEPFRTMIEENNRKTVPCIFRVELIGGFDNFSAIFDQSGYTSSEKSSSEE